MSASADSNPALSEREAMILRAVVQSYTTTAEPVGSRTIVKRFDLPLSAATVRNVMADLEDAGFLEQRHTSSGRVPTDIGYRYYVNRLMEVQRLTMAERERIEREFNQRLAGTDDLMRHTCHLLALASHHTSIVEAPGDGSADIRRIEVIPLGERRIAVMIADSFGRVHTVSLEQETPIPEPSLRKVGAFLNEHFVGSDLDGLPEAVRSKVAEFLDEQHRIAEQAAALIGMLPMPRRGQLFLEGATQIFEQPEFKDIEKAREVFMLLDERERLTNLLHAKLIGHDGASVIIGSEGDRDGLGELSIVTAPYRVGDREVGVVGVLGPRRMPYSRITAVVNYTADLLSKMLTKLAR